MIVNKIIPISRPINAGGRINFKIRQSAFLMKRRKPTKSMAISSGNKIAKDSFMLDWLAIKGKDNTPRPAPNPLFEIPTTMTLTIAQMKNTKECAWKDWAIGANKVSNILWVYLFSLLLFAANCHGANQDRARLFSASDEGIATDECNVKQHIA